MNEVCLVVWESSLVCCEVTRFSFHTDNGPILKVSETGIEESEGGVREHLKEWRLFHQRNVLEVGVCYGKNWTLSWVKESVRTLRRRRSERGEEWVLNSSRVNWVKEVTERWKEGERGCFVWEERVWDKQRVDFRGSESRSEVHKIGLSDF